MQIPFVNLKRQHQWLQPQLNNIQSDFINSNQFMGGEAVNDFEDEFASYLSVPYVISCANATDALEIVLRAWNVGKGDEVIVPANGWMSAAETVCLVGATPVLVDNHPDTFNINLDLLKEKISKYTRVIIPIHLYGNPVDMNRLTKIAERQNIKVLEDCAQSHGASVYKKKVGSWGKVGIYSFYPTKNLGALGDAGAITTSDPEIALCCRAVATHGQFEKHIHDILGRNSRMDALQARILSLKLPFLDKWNQRRRQIASYYHQAWSSLPIRLPQQTENSVWHLFVIQVNNRDRVQKELMKRGIQTGVHYPIPVCQQPIFREFRQPEGYPNAERQAAQLLSIPVYPELTDEEVEYIAETLKKVIEDVAASSPLAR